MVTKISSIGILGIDGYLIHAETDVTAEDEFSFDIVGLPDTAVKEAKNRVMAAIKNSYFKLKSVKVVTNLAPASIKKEGSSFDLPIALGFLTSTEQLPQPSEKSAFLGELSLSGEIKRCSGILAAVITARQLGFKEIFIPEENTAEGGVIDGIDIYAVKSLEQLAAHLKGQKTLLPIKDEIQNQISAKTENINDFSDIIGQQSAKRACEIAAAGGHNMLLVGSPGTGKSMLAKCLPSILPDMTFEEMIESSKIYSIAGKLDEKMPLINVRPFVKTNQSVSVAAMTGGGANATPGLISLAHNGVLFLDETPQFSTAVLNSLRQPIEDNLITISRVKQTLTYPATFMLVCAMNPCPCGNFGHPHLKCTCSQNQISKYVGRLSGPFLDRLDIQVELPPIPLADIKSSTPTETSAEIKKRVDNARKIQQARYKGTDIACNGKLSPGLIREYSKKRLTAGATALLDNVFTKKSLSMRAYDKIIKLSQTIADLSGSDSIEVAHISEAIYFRSLDKKYFHR